VTGSALNDTVIAGGSVVARTLDGGGGTGDTIS
jgi:hypothetical protein